MPEAGLIAVAIEPLHHPSETIVSGVAALLGKDIYDTGMMLAGKSPKILFRLPDPASADDMACRLRELGLLSFTVRESDLQAPAVYFRANRVTFEESAVTFEDRNGQSRRLIPGAVFLILKGRSYKRTETTEKTTRRKLNISGTLLMGGIPIMKTETKTVKGVSTETALFLRLHKRDSMDPEVELRQNDIDYSFLGIKMASTSLGNFNLLTRKIRESFPGAAFNDDLMEPGRVDLSPLSPVDASVANSRLTYFYYRQMAGG
jgi:hypothetical protein